MYITKSNETYQLWDNKRKLIARFKSMQEINGMLSSLRPKKSYSVCKCFICRDGLY